MQKLLSLTVLLALTAQAQMATTVEVAPAAPTKAFGISLGITGVSSLKPAGEADYEAGLELEAIPSYKISEVLSTSITLSGTQELTGERNFVADDSIATLSYSGVELSDGSRLKASGGVYIPLSEASRKRNKRWTGLMLGSTLAADLGKMLDFSAVSLNVSYALNGYRNIHEYSTSSDGKSLSQWALRHTLSVELGLPKGFSLSGVVAMQSSWTYGGVPRTSFRHEEAISYAPIAQLQISAGHRVDWQSVLAADGESSNYFLFDGMRSQVFLGITSVL